MISNYARRQSPHPYAHDNRKRVKVDVRPRSLMIADLLVDHGVSVVEIPDTITDEDLDRLTVDASRLKDATEMRARKREQYREATGRDPNMSTISVESCYREMYQADMPPLNSFEVLERDLPAPLTDVQKQQTAIAQAVATAVVEGKSAGTKKSRRTSKDEG